MKKQYFLNANIIDTHNSLNEIGGLIIDDNGLIEAIGKSDGMSKKIVQEALRLKIPIERTWSCYEGDKVACGKCDSCRIRDAALKKVGRSDLCSYK